MKRWTPDDVLAGECRGERDATPSESANAFALGRTDYRAGPAWHDARIKQPHAAIARGRAKRRPYGARGDASHARPQPGRVEGDKPKAIHTPRAITRVQAAVKEKWS